MNENWIEGIKRNDEITMLDRYFPGKSCGNTECEQHCIELCKIAERIGAMKKNEIASAVARLLAYPENCPALKSGPNHESCRSDMLPYWIWGNTKDDPTVFFKRLTGRNNLNELWEDWFGKKE